MNSKLVQLHARRIPQQWFLYDVSLDAFVARAACAPVFYGRRDSKLGATVHMDDVRACDPTDSLNYSFNEISDATADWRTRSTAHFFETKWILILWKRPSSICLPTSSA